MDRTTFEHILACIARESRSHVARASLHRLREHATAPWIDAELRGRLRALCEAHGLACTWTEPAALGIGEAWLLLAGRNDTGAVVRLRANGDGDDPGPDAADQARKALFGLHSAVAACGRRIPSHAIPRRFAILGGAPRLEIVGSSLGLSSAVATLSAALNRPPRANVAGTAAVDADGTLHPVGQVAQKVAALRAQWPEVDTLVVAAAQDGVDRLAAAIRIVRAADLASACGHFGLAFHDLQACTRDARRFRLGPLEAENERAHDSAQWLELSAEAWEIARALVGEQGREAEAMKARLLSALFASHAGDNEHAQRILSEVSESDLEDEPALLTQKLIYQAASRIEYDPTEAAMIARRAVALCSKLRRSERDQLRGQALGTEGRAHMHAGEYAKAESLLREALAHHRERLAHEWPRSACYLATCLRRAGRTAEALELTREALAETERQRNRVFAETTAYYLHLEQGRILADLGHLADAAHELEIVIRAQSEPEAYPRLGAHRSLVQVFVRLGRADEAREHLRTCVAVACGSGRETLCKVGAVAAAEALLSGAPPLPRADLEQAWNACFPKNADRAEAVRLWIY